MPAYCNPGMAKRLLVVGMSIAALTASCGGAQVSGSPPPSAGVQPTSLALPSSAPAAEPTPTVAPTETVARAISWSKPALVEKSHCLVGSAAIDDSGRAHVASECSGSIDYSVANGDRWQTTRLPHPADRIDKAPQLAFEGNTMYLGFTRVKILDGGCGDNGLSDVGVNVRQRELPAGDWKSPQRIGSPTDGLVALRVVDSTIHLLVKDRSDNRLYYETFQDGTLGRYRLPGAVGGASLRIGDDGRARIVYEGGQNLQYAVFDGSGFTHAGIPGSSLGWGPSLVLDPQNHAHAIWMRSYHDGGCAEPEPESWFGTYYGSNETGTWTYRRLSSQTNGASLTLDTETGRIHVALSGRLGIRYLTKLGSGPWRETRITTKADWAPIIKLDQRTGKLLVVYNGSEGEISAVTGD